MRSKDYGHDVLATPYLTTRLVSCEPLTLRRFLFTLESLSPST